MDMSHAGRLGNTVTLNGRIPEDVAVAAGERLAACGSSTVGQTRGSSPCASMATTRSSSPVTAIR